ncbi:MAG: metallophosphoesterase [Planctomycetes bacterium]|nr:metallophosphoesterase [Planctomycetota bacterium]
MKTRRHPSRSWPLRWETLILTLFALTVHAPARASEVTRGPYLSALSARQVHIRWFASDASGEWSVRYSVDGAGAWATQDAGTAQPCSDPFCPGGGFRFDVALTGLVPSTAYLYDVVHDEISQTSDLASGGTPLMGSFRTPSANPLDPVVTSLVAFGDSGAGTSKQIDIALRSLDRAPHAVLHTGDMFYGDEQTGQLEPYFYTPYRELMARTCMFPCMGNEDYVHDFFIEDHFTLTGVGPGSSARYYSFDFGPAHVTVLDTQALIVDYLQPATTGATADPSQIQWMCNDLQAAHDGGIPWQIVVCHVPPFNIGAHAIDESGKLLRQLLAPYFTEFSVDLVLSGHDHNYQRSWPVIMNETKDCTVPFDPFVPLDCAGGDPAACYYLEVVPDEEWTHLDGTVYVICGGGGQYGHPIPLPPIGVATWDDTWDTAFNSVQYAGVPLGSYVLLELTPTTLDLRAFDDTDMPVDAIRVSKLRAVRGDVNGDGAVDISDPIAMVNGLFTVGAHPVCEVIGDANGDAAFDVADVIHVLTWLFVPGAPSPVVPFPDCGPIPEMPGEHCLRQGC